MSGDWPTEGQPPVPPGWEDPEEELGHGADQLDAEAEARLSEVAAYLASVPTPVLPEAVAARISAALAGEAAARSADGGRARASSPSAGAAADTDVPADTARTLGPASARGRAGRRRSGGSNRRSLRSLSRVAAGSVGACLVLAGLGYGLSRVSSSSSSSSAGSDAAGSSYAPGASAAAPALGTNAGSASMSFVVSVSGTKYQAATLAEQVRARLAVPAAGGSASVSVPAPTAPSSASTTVPASALRGCVLHLTAGRSPRLVDQATYQGKAAYIIASSSHVWVVGLGCTAANPELVASVPLAG